MDKIKVVLIDDHGIVRDALRTHFARQDGPIEVVAEGSRPRDAVTLVPEFQPDIVLLDLKMPREDEAIFSAEQAIHWLERNAPRVRIVILSGHIAPEYVQMAASDRVYGYVHKDESLAFLEEALGQVMIGRRVLSQQIIEQIAAMPKRKRRSEPGALSPRELEVAGALVDYPNLTQEERAGMLRMALTTLKTHQQHIAEKLGVANHELVIFVELQRRGVVSRH